MAWENEQLGERTHEPTMQRLAKAAQRGQIPRTPDLAAVLVMLGALAALNWCGGSVVRSLTDMTGTMLGSTVVDASHLSGRWLSATGSVVMALLPMWLAILVLAVAVNVAQVGLRIAGEPVRPDWRRVSIAAGMARMFSLRTLERMGMLLAKLAGVGLVAYWTIRPSLPRLAVAGADGPGGLLSEAASLTWQLGIRCGMVLLALALLEYLYQRWQHRRDLRMSRRELMDELKQSEGSGLRHKTIVKVADVETPTLKHPTPNETVMNHG